MARLNSFQPSFVLYLAVLASLKMSFHRVRSQGYRDRQLHLAASRCPHGLSEKVISCAGMGLEDVPQDLFPGVEELDLSENFIIFIYNSSFSPYRFIRKLSLFRNNIATIALGSFYPMPVLQYLNLGENLLNKKNVTSGLFKFSTKMSHLNFSRTPVERFANDTIKWLPRLEVLDLRYTILSYLNISSCTSEAHTLNFYLGPTFIRTITHSTFIINCDLNLLYLDFNKIARIDSNAIASIRSRTLVLGRLTTFVSPNLWRPFLKGIANSEIEKLFLHTPQVRQIDPLYFAPLRNKPLKVLDLSHNNLININGMGFLTLPLLSTLVLNHCSILSLNPADFVQMQNLDVLNLNHNNIASIEGVDSNTTWDIDLRELHLAYNKLWHIDDRVLKGLTNLENLVLRGNRKLMFLAITPFTGLESLKSIDLSGCSLATLWIYYVPILETFIYSDCERSENMNDIGQTFSRTKSIKHVFLRNAGINTLWTPSEDETTVSLFHGMRNLTDLDIKKNPLRLLQSRLFVDLFFLKELDLSYCQLEKIEENAFEGLLRLQTLYVQGNNLRDLPRRLLQNVGQLMTIHLNDNALRYLERDLFSNSSKLLNLTLAGNQLSGFNRSTFEPIFNTIRVIDISKNEFACTCDLKWLPKWLSKITLMNENETTCSTASLEELQGKHLMSFNPSELCGPNIALYCSLPFGIAWTVAILLFAYRHRWFLKYKIFLLKLAVIGYQEIRDARDLNDFEFHFNIMFAEEDEEWVRNHLRLVLEDQLPEYNKNVYGDNDLPLGMHYCDAVHYVVEMSYKTIMVISRAAIQDNWFVIKFRAAADQVSDTQLENMVVIFVEDIPDDELPFIVRLYLSDRMPYLSWEEDERFQEYFWQKLTKMLTINLRCNNLIPPE